MVLQLRRAGEQAEPVIELDASDPAGPGRGLTAEEDAVLRRLHFFETTGVTLAEPMRMLKNELRARDQRSDIREPVFERILWPAAG
jgi:hypothetical protein